MRVRIQPTLPTRTAVFLRPFFLRRFCFTPQVTGRLRALYVCPGRDSVMVRRGLIDRIGATDPPVEDPVHHPRRNGGDNPMWYRCDAPGEAIPASPDTGAITTLGPGGQTQGTGPTDGCSRDYRQGFGGTCTPHCS